MKFDSISSGSTYSVGFNVDRFKVLSKSQNSFKVLDMGTNNEYILSPAMSYYFLDSS